MPRRNYPGKGNVLKFQNEMRAEVQQIIDKGFPGGVRAIALALRDALEDQTPVGSHPPVKTSDGGRRSAGLLKASWTAGIALNTDQAGGEQSAAAALANMRPGDEVLVYETGKKSQSPYYGWFIDQGWTDKGGTYHAPRQIVRAAIERVRDMAVKV